MFVQFARSNGRIRPAEDVNAKAFFAEQLIAINCKYRSRNSADFRDGPLHYFEFDTAIIHSTSFTNEALVIMAHRNS